MSPKLNDSLLKKTQGNEIMEEGYCWSAGMARAEVWSTTAGFATQGTRKRRERWRWSLMRPSQGPTLHNREREKFRTSRQTPFEFVL